MKKTVVCTFYNEEYLLPFFLKHHREVFDHGVMIDYHSTDNSRAIIKELCPTWDIVMSRNNDFQADRVDVEIMEYEAMHEGWRMCLNVTELLLGDTSILNDQPRQILVPSMFIVDKNQSQIMSHDLPLWEQKKDGFMFDSPQNFFERRARSIHSVPVKYALQSTVECMGPGRHFNKFTTDELVVMYYGWAPLNAEGMKRKLQIQTQTPLHDRQCGWGYHHITNKETVEYRLETDFIPRSKDLTTEIEHYVSKHKNISNLL